MNPEMLAKIGQALGGLSQGAGNPGGGLMALMSKLRGRMHPSQGADVPQTPYHFPHPSQPNDPGMMPGSGVGAYPMQPMTPGGFGTLPNQGPNIGPGMPNDYGEPGMPGGPVELGGRRPRKRFDFTGGY